MIAGLIKLLLYILLIIIIIRILVWIFFPFLFSRPQNHDNPTRKQHKKEGDVTIDYIPKKNKKIDKDSGDYTDFEEIR